MREESKRAFNFHKEKLNFAPLPNLPNFTKFF